MRGSDTIKRQRCRHKPNSRAPCPQKFRVAPVVEVRRGPLTCPGSLQVRLGGRSYQSHELPNVQKRKGVASSLDETDDEQKYGALGMTGRSLFVFMRGPGKGRAPLHNSPKILSDFGTSPVRPSDHIGVFGLIARFLPGLVLRRMETGDSVRFRVMSVAPTRFPKIPAASSLFTRSLHPYGLSFTVSRFSFARVGLSPSSKLSIEDRLNHQMRAMGPDLERMRKPAHIRSPSRDVMRRDHI